MGWLTLTSTSILRPFHVVIMSVPQHACTTGSNWVGPALFRTGKDPSPSCSEPTRGLGRVAGPGEQKKLQAPPAPIREEAGSSCPLPLPAVQLCPLPVDTVLVGQGLSRSAQLSSDSLNSKRRHWTGLPGWCGGGGHTMAKTVGSSGGQGCHPQSEGATGGHWHGGFWAA